MKKINLLSTLLLLFIFKVNAQTNVPSVVSNNQVWDINGSPYILNQNTYIDTGVSVIVMPGVEVKAPAFCLLSVGGEFQALGKWDSMVLLNNFELSYQAGSKKYNKLNNKGAYLNYCKVIGAGSGRTAVSTKSTSLKVTNSEFENAYYGIYVTATGSDTNYLYVHGNKFSGDAFNNGTPVYCMSTRFKTFITDNLFTKTAILYLEGEMVFKNNTINKMKYLNFYIHGKSEIMCNKFLNIDNLINLYFFTSTGKGDLTFDNNTIDSVGSGSFNPMIKITRNNSNSAPFGRMQFRNNNFLHLNGTAGKIQIQANNQSPTTTDTLDFTSNYWGTNDSATIETFIRDYNDNVMTYGRINFSNYSATPINGCSYSSLCAIPSFTYVVADSLVHFTDKSVSSAPYTVYWSFGDGIVSQDKNPSHIYQNPGNYLACLYVYDSLNNFCDSFCKAINIIEKSSCEASYYFAVDTITANVIYIVNTSTGVNSKTNYYWTFGDGNGSSNKNPSHQYNAAGVYNLCLTIFDTVANCYSTFCDSIYIGNEQMMLMVLNESDVLSIGKPGNSDYTIAVYPNPTDNDRIFLNLTSTQQGECEFYITGIDGKEIISGKHHINVGNNEFEINLSAISAGVYYIVVNTQNQNKMIKLIVNK